MHIPCRWNTLLPVAYYCSIKFMKIFTVTLSKQDVPPEIMGNVCDQIQQIQKVPKRLDEYTAEEIQAFPRLFDW